MYILIGKKQKRSPNKRDRYYLTDVTSYEDGVIHEGNEDIIMSDPIPARFITVL